MTDYPHGETLDEYEYDENAIYNNNSSDLVLSDDNSDESNDNNVFDYTIDSMDEFSYNVITAPSCPICLKHYNTDERIVKFINNCGHSVCNSCLYHIDQCPICRKNITKTTINWIIHSELSKKAKEKIHPIYKIFIDFKDEIENLYLNKNFNHNNLNSDEKKLINQIKMRFKGIKIKIKEIDFIFENLLIPEWLKENLIKSLGKIEKYQKYLENKKISNLEELLPFCP